MVLSANCSVIFPFLDLGMDDEGDDDPVPLPNVNAAILKKVRWWKWFCCMAVKKCEILGVGYYELLVRKYFSCATNLTKWRCMNTGMWAEVGRWVMAEDVEGWPGAAAGGQTGFLRCWSGAGHRCTLAFHGVKALILIGFCELWWPFMRCKCLEKGLRFRQWWEWLAVAVLKRYCVHLGVLNSLTDRGHWVKGESVVVWCPRFFMLSNRVMPK